MKRDASQGKTGMKPLRIRQFGFCLFIYFGTLVMLVLTLVFMLGFTLALFDSVGAVAGTAIGAILSAICTIVCAQQCLAEPLWVEIGDRLIYRKLFSGTHTHNWNEVKGIAVRTSGGNYGHASRLEITLANSKELQFSITYDEYVTLQNIFRTLVDGLKHENLDTRERAAIALGRFGALECSYNSRRIVQEAVVVDLRKEMMGHLEQALKDKHEKVRKAFADALQRTYEKLQSG